MRGASSSVGITTEIITAREPSPDGPPLPRKSPAGDGLCQSADSIDWERPIAYLWLVPRPPKPDHTAFTTTAAPAYARAGVDLDHDESFVDDIKEIAKSTFRPEVLSSIGGFAGMFKAPDRYKDPIFVAATDGVGTKLKLASQVGRYDTIGIDCVAMVVNDLVVQGAEPIIFLDYVAMGDLSKTIAGDTLRGVAEGCRRAGCALLGGETATMPGVYAKGDVELVGFSVGVVERDGVIDGSNIAEGDVLIGIASSGFHSNGYSLVRSILDAGIAAGHGRPLRPAAGAADEPRERAARADAHLRQAAPQPDPRLRGPRPRPRHGRRLRGQRARACCRAVCAPTSIPSPGPAPTSTPGSRGSAGSRSPSCCASSTAASA